MAIFQGASGLSEDKVVNVFHFKGGSAYDVDAPFCALNVHDFYSGIGVAPRVQSASIGAWLSPWLKRTWETRTYDLELPKKERPPTITEWDLGAPAGSNGLPEEMAVCLSYSGAPPYTPRRRGRIYIGPLITTACDFGNDERPSKPNDGFINDLLFAATRLSSLSDPDDSSWMLRSTRPTENFVEIRTGYVDNAFDNQLRRGPDASTRLPFFSERVGPGL